MHLTWNPCPHGGNSLTNSPSSNSAKQMAQSDNFKLPADPISNETVGNELRTFFLIPLLVVWGEEVDWGGADRLSHAQRATRARPNMQMTAHRREARTTTTSESIERFMDWFKSGNWAEDWRNLVAGGIFLFGRISKWIDGSVVNELLFIVLGKRRE